MTTDNSSKFAFNTGVIRPIECVQEGWELIKSDYWLFFAISLVGGLIAGVTMYILIGAMVCGIMTCYLNKIDGKPVAFEDLWKGFSYLGPSALVTIIFVVPMVIFFMGMFVAIYSPLIMTAVMGNNADPSIILGTLAAALGIEAVVGFLMIIVHSLMVFCFPLIIDRKLSSIDSLKLSARAALKNIGGIAGLMGVNFLLAMIGSLACSIGVYFVVPIMTAGSLVAYRKVFPKLESTQY